MVLDWQEWREDNRPEDFEDVLFYLYDIEQIYFGYYRQQTDSLHGVPLDGVFTGQNRGFCVELWPGARIWWAYFSAPQRASLDSIPKKSSHLYKNS